MRDRTDKIKSTIESELHFLRKEVERLRSMGRSAGHEGKVRFQTAVNGLEGRVEGIYDDASKKMHRAAKSSRHQISERPFTAVMIAFAAGAVAAEMASWCIGRCMRR